LKIQDLQAEINAIDQENAQIESSEGQAIVKKLLNIIERLASSNDAQESELQKLRDEINRLKGEQGKPDIKATANQARIPKKKRNVSVSPNYPR
jgi:predicted  nucleic acid-binding Zn-ribbon protein